MSISILGYATANVIKLSLFVIVMLKYEILYVVCFVPFRFEPELKEYLQFLSDKLSNKLKPRSTTKQITGIVTAYTI